MALFAWVATCLAQVLSKISPRTFMWSFDFIYRDLKLGGGELSFRYKMQSSVLVSFTFKPESLSLLDITFNFSSINLMHNCLLFCCDMAKLSLAKFESFKFHKVGL